MCLDFNMKRQNGNRIRNKCVSMFAGAVWSAKTMMVFGFRVTTLCLLDIPTVPSATVNHNNVEMSLRSAEKKKGRNY